MAIRIIKEQELIIGPIAWEEAGHVKGQKKYFLKSLVWQS